MKKLLLIQLFIGTTLINFSCKKEESSEIAPQQGIYFAKVKLIIKNNCTTGCHSPSTGNLTGLPIILDNDSDIVLHAPSIKASVIDPISLYNKRMPKTGSLSTTEINDIEKWFSLGGKSTD